MRVSTVSCSILRLRIQYLLKHQLESQRHAQMGVNLWSVCNLQQYDYVDRPPAPLTDQINLAVDSLCTLGPGANGLQQQTQ